jgi:hypothetical protein
LAKVDKNLLYEDVRFSNGGKPKVSPHPEVKQEMPEPQEEKEPRTPMKSQDDDLVAPMPQQP